MFGIVNHGIFLDYIWDPKHFSVLVLILSQRQALESGAGGLLLCPLAFGLQSSTRFYLAPLAIFIYVKLLGKGHLEFWPELPTICR